MLPHLNQMVDDATADRPIPTGACSSASLTEEIEHANRTATKLTRAAGSLSAPIVTRSPVQKCSANQCGTLNSNRGSLRLLFTSKEGKAPDETYPITTAYARGKVEVGRLATLGCAELLNRLAGSWFALAIAPGLPFEGFGQAQQFVGDERIDGAARYASAMLSLTEQILLCGHGFIRCLGRRVVDCFFGPVNAVAGSRFLGPSWRSLRAPAGTPCERSSRAFSKRCAFPVRGPTSVLCSHAACARR